MLQADVSLIIPCRNDRDNVRRLVTEARPWVREIVIVDTMSDDGSPEAAKEAGADIVSLRPDLIHEDGLLRSFAEVHNEAYALATRPWRLWLHTDDTLGDKWHLVPGLVEVAEQGYLHHPCFSIQLWCDYTWNEDRSQCVQSLKYRRFIHRAGGWKWFNPVHESLECQHRNLECPSILDERIRVIHLSQGSRSLQGDRTLRMLRRWEAEGCKPDDNLVVLKFHLGDELFVRQQYDEARTYLLQIAATPETEPWTVVQVQAALRVGQSLMLQGKYKEMWEYVRPLMEKRPDISNFYWNLAWASLFRLGNIQMAHEIATAALRAPTWVHGESTRQRDAILDVFPVLNTS